MPDFCLLVVGANMGVQRMTKEHISIACALQVNIKSRAATVRVFPAIVSRCLRPRREIIIVFELRGYTEGVGSVCFGEHFSKNFVD